MCLAVPGKIITVKNDAAGIGDVATVDFQGSRIPVSLAFTPEAREGDWVLVHAGFALQVLDEQAARKTWEYLDEADLVELSEAAPRMTEERGREGERGNGHG
ncbi:MAG: HypC/HybG/HupF family hydrogenase formation chaperone [Phycisphaerae bacterium]|jgi:hydrogenase expression/formation protein HypC